MAKKTRQIKKKRRKGQGKGGAFERKLSKLLSMWWTDGIRDDIFWRTSASGARATARSKRNKVTCGQYGDIGITDYTGRPLISLCVIEAKNGYDNQCIFDLLDKPKATSIYYKWISKLEKEVEDGHAPYWLLIHKRSQREAVVVIPDALYKKFRTRPVRRVRIIDDRFQQKIVVSVMLLKDFFRYVRPNQIKRWAKG